MTVTDATIAAVGHQISATEGQPFTGSIATFTDPDANATASEYSATISWGDGTATTSTGTITLPPGGPFTITRSHTFAEQASSYTVTVTVVDIANPGNTTTTTSAASVAEAPLMITGIAASASNNRRAIAGVTFADADLNRTLSDYNASD